MDDPSNGYDAVAREFIEGRGKRDQVGASTVRTWAKRLPKGATVLDLGCGTGVPISKTLIEEGLVVYGVDASPNMIAAFRERFPNVPCECSTVEASDFFNRTFDGVVAWGLMFLLGSKAQSVVVKRVAAALRPGGRFLFTAPRQTCEWSDNLTGRKSLSLGLDVYTRMLEREGLLLVGEEVDEGENHYYFATRG